MSDFEHILKAAPRLGNDPARAWTVRVPAINKAAMGERHVPSEQW